MGAGIGKRLTERGARVLTSLKGRGPASAARARDAGMADVADAELVSAGQHVILSVVPPGEAVALAERLKPRARARDRTSRSTSIATPSRLKPPSRSGRCLRAPAAAMSTAASSAGRRPAPTAPTSTVRVRPPRRPCGSAGIGLNIRLVEGPIGAASALKMSYAGITKGFTAIGTAMMLGAVRAGCAEALRRELSESQPQLAAWLTRQVPRMFPKAYRWVAEMEEIAEFLGDDEAAPGHVHRRSRELYERIAAGADQTSDRSGARACMRCGRFAPTPPEKLSKAG